MKINGIEITANAAKQHNGEIIGSDTGRQHKIRYWIASHIPNLFFASLALLLTLCVGVATASALIIGTAYYGGALSIITDRDFYVVVDGVEFEGKKVVAGESIALYPTVFNQDEMDAYVFVKIELGDGLEIEGLNSDWQKLDEPGVYAYNGKLEAGTETTIFDGIKVHREAASDEEFSVEAYAVYAGHFGDGVSLETVWKTVKGERGY